MTSIPEWRQVVATYGEGVGSRASIGLIALSTDRVGVWDAEQFVDGVPGAAVFSTRIPMSPLGTPETLMEMKSHLSDATNRLVGGSRLDVIGFSCTSGTVAIGVNEVHSLIDKARPGTPVTTPIEAGVKALRLFGARRISLLVPYLLGSANLISGFFEQAGFTIDSRSTFGLKGDIQINAVSDEALVEAAASSCHSNSEALFISCTGLKTSSVIEKIERVLGKPVVTSNQALAWDCLRLASVKDNVPHRGSLLAEH